MINQKWKKEFRERLDHCFEEMKWLYYELYHGDEQAFRYFLKMLY